MENAIEVKHLSKHYKDFTLEDISLHVPAGSVLGFSWRKWCRKIDLYQISCWIAFF